MQVRALVLAVLASASLVACGRGADSGATSNPNAPGSPGTGNAVTTSTPQQGDSSSGRGSSGMAGSAPHPGSSGGDAVVGVTGKGAPQANDKSQDAPPAAGLNGGLGESTGTSMGAGGAKQDQAAKGSTNSTPRGSVGNR